MYVFPCEVTDTTLFKAFTAGLGLFLCAFTSFTRRCCLLVKVHKFLFGQRKVLPTKPKPYCIFNSYNCCIWWMVDHKNCSPVSIWTVQGSGVCDVGVSPRLTGSTGIFLLYHYFIQRGRPNKVAPSHDAVGINVSHSAETSLWQSNTVPVEWPCPPNEFGHS